MKRLEAYLLKTGKLRYYFAWWFAARYSDDINKVVTYFRIWQCMQEGLDGYSVYRVFLQAYSWKFEQFQRAIEVCLYTGELTLTDPYSRFSTLKLARPTESGAVEGNERPGRKEASIA